MLIEEFVEKINSLNFTESLHKTLRELINYKQLNKIERLYFLENDLPKFILDNQEVINIFFHNMIEKTLEEYLKEKINYYIDTVPFNKHIIDTYNFLRSKKLFYAPVIKDNKIIGEINFQTLSLKISFIAIKDDITNAYNEKYFNVLIEEYNEISDNIGIVMVKIFNLEIFESFYGYEFVKKILKKVSEVIRNSIRDVDFIFRNDSVFKIITFNNAEITLKIKERIEEKLKNFEVNDIKIPTKVVGTQIPELENSVIVGLEKLEEKLIKRD